MNIKVQREMFSISSSSDFSVMLQIFCRSPLSLGTWSSLQSRHSPLMDHNILSQRQHRVLFVLGRNMKEKTFVVCRSDERESAVVLT